MSNLKSKIFQLLFLKLLFPLYYLWEIRKPVKPGKILFIEVRFTSLSDNFQLLKQRAEQEPGIETVCFFAGYGSLGTLQYLKQCFLLLHELADAQAAFLNEASNTISAVSLRKETKLIQTWHGCGAFKKFGYSIPGQLKEAYYRNYSFVTVSSPAVIPIYMEAMQLQESQVKAIGVSRTDRFFDMAYREKAINKLYEKIPAAQNKKVILYAPTFRGSHLHAHMPDALDLQMLFTELNQDYIVLVKNHPFVKERLAFQEKMRQFVFDVTDLWQIDELLCVCDICITDYSSLVFEFSLLEKPIIFFAHDLEAYFDERGFYYAFEKFVPGPIVKNTQELIADIKKADHSFSLEQIRNFKEKFMSACDGTATEKIWHEVMKGRNNECDN